MTMTNQVGRIGIVILSPRKYEKQRNFKECDRMGTTTMCLSGLNTANFSLERPKDGLHRKGYNKTKHDFDNKATKQSSENCEAKTNPMEPFTATIPAKTSGPTQPRLLPRRRPLRFPSKALSPSLRRVHRLHTIAPARRSRSLPENVPLGGGDPLNSLHNNLPRFRCRPLFPCELQFSRNVPKRGRG